MLRYAVASLCFLPSCICTPFTSKHFIGICSNGGVEQKYWTEISVAAEGSMRLDSVRCVDNDAATNGEIGMKNAIDQVLPGGANGDRPLLLAFKPSGVDETNYVRALRAGVAIIFIENTINMELMSLSQVTAFRVYAGTNQRRTAHFAVGEELCRSHGHRPHRVVAFLCFVDREHPNNDRVTDALARFREVCPQTPITVAYNLSINFSSSVPRHDQAKAMLPFFQDRTITTVLAYADYLAVAAIAAAEEMEYPPLIVTGYDGTDTALADVKRGRMFATVRQLVNIPLTDPWRVINRFVGKIEAASQPLHNTMEIQKYFSLSSNDLTYDHMLVSSDGAGLMTTNIRQRFNPVLLPTTAAGIGRVMVNITMRNLQVESFMTDEGLFIAMFWLRIQYDDFRLKWDPFKYDGVLEWPVDYVWSPDVYFSNGQEESTNIWRSRATINHAGTITIIEKHKGRFTCAMNTKPYPFSMYECSVRVACASNSVSLQGYIEGGIRGFGDPVLTFIENGTSDVTDLHPELNFKFKVQNDPAPLMDGFFVFQCALNLMSFTQFWMPPEEDRTQITLTTILASSVLQDGAYYGTWMGRFSKISLLFQLFCFFLSVTSLSRFGNSVTRRRLSEISIDTGLCRVLKTFCNFIWGTSHACAEDRIGRSVVVPSFFVLIIAMVSTPRRGEMDITVNDKSTEKSTPLFWMSAVVVGFYVVTALIRMVIAFIDKMARMKEKELERTEQQLPGTPTFPPVPSSGAISDVNSLQLAAGSNSGGVDSEADKTPASGPNAPAAGANSGGGLAL